jgi:hypothetical protein
MKVCIFLARVFDEPYASPGMVQFSGLDGGGPLNDARTVHLLFMC